MTVFKSDLAQAMTAMWISGILIFAGLNVLNLTGYSWIVSCFVSYRIHKKTANKKLESGKLFSRGFKFLSLSLFFQCYSMPGCRHLVRHGDEASPFAQTTPTPRLPRGTWRLGELGNLMGNHLLGIMGYIL